MNSVGKPSVGECVIVGGGIIGLSLAHELLERGLRVLVLERGEAGHGATHASAGMLAPISEAEVETAELIALAFDSRARYRETVERWERDGEIDCGYRDEGTLWVATTRDEHEELQHLAETLRLKELEVRTLDAAELVEHEPHLSRRALSGLYVAEDHQVNPRALVRCLTNAVRQRGGQIATGAHVTEIVEAGGRIRSVRGRSQTGESFEIGADCVALCAGAWSAEGIEIPVELEGLRPVKGQILRLRGEPLLSHVVRTPDVYLVPRSGGDLLVGATTEEMGFDEQPTAGAVMDLLRHAWDVLPGVYDLELNEVCVGLRPALSRPGPCIGVSSVDGLFLALGHYRHGILLAPATAHHLAEAILTGSHPSLIEPFAPVAQVLESRPT